MAKTVFDNAMTAHDWAHGNGEARSHNGNMYARGDVLFSYGEHFPLAVRIEGKRGLLFLLNAATYSLTTSAHQVDVWRACHGLGDVVYLHGLSALSDRLCKPSLKTVRRVLESAVNAFLNQSDIDLVLAAFGSKANPAIVQRRAQKAQEKERREEERREQKRYLELARKALSLPLAAYTGEEYLEHSLIKHMPVNTARYATELNRAWRHAKAAGWGKKKLRKLREREQALRAHGQRVENRQAYRIQNSRKLSAIRRLRELQGEAPSLAVAFERGSLRKRGIIARILPYGGFAALGIPARAWRSAKEQFEKHVGAEENLLGNIRAATHKMLSDSALEREAAAVAAWKRGEPIPVPRSMRGADVMLRAVNVQRDESGAITGGELQTSHGARVPLTHAVKLFKFLKRVRERLVPDNEIAWRSNGARARVGHFDVDYIYGSGTFKAGCHVIEWHKSRDLAQALGVFDLEPSDAIVRQKEEA